MLLPLIIIAFFITLIFMVALRPVAASIGLVDRPGGRKRHSGDVPIVGGIAMFLGQAIALSIMLTNQPSLLHLAIAGGLLIVIGVLDDKYSLPASVRLITQIVAVLIMVFGADLQLDNIGNTFGFGVIYLGPMSLIITLLISISLINAFNLVDGLDGLSGTMALIALSAIAIIGGNQSPVSMIALIAAASIAGFLYFNLPSRHNRSVLTFMGDAGSTFVGFVIAWVMVSAAQGTEAFVTPVICLWFVAMPVFDLFTCFVKRSMQGHSPFRPGRDHFHHILRRSGMGVQKVLLTLAGLQVIYAVIALFGHYAGVADVVMFTGWAIAGVSQHWIIRKFSALYRLGLRRRQVQGIPATDP